MNAQMRLVIMLGSVAVSGSLLFAAESTPPPQAAPESASERPSAKPPVANTGAAAGKDTARKPAAASSPDTAGSPQRFTPSEQVRADFDVSFPVDI